MLLVTKGIFHLIIYFIASSNKGLSELFIMKEKIKKITQFNSFQFEIKLNAKLISIEG
jgi:hypothetical protein